MAFWSRKPKAPVAPPQQGLPYDSDFDTSGDYDDDADFAEPTQTPAGDGYASSSSDSGEDAADGDRGFGSAPAGGGLHFVVDDRFTIKGRGTVVTGKVESGVVRTGDQVTITPGAGGDPWTATCTGIEALRKMLDEATAGANVGLLLTGSHVDDLQRGDVISEA